ncbi:hypothetical protein CFE70_002479 [Pyrenophora teres f. teres 0-1]
MSWPEDNAKQFAPAQVIAQVAPPSPVSAPLPGAHTKPQSDADIAPEPADTLPLSSRIPTAMSESDSILCLVLSAAGVDSPKGAQPRINPKVRSVSPVDDINSSSKASDHKVLELRLQEETQVDNMRPITPPLTQNCDTGVSATSSITPLPVVHEILPDSNTLESPIIYSNAQKNLACGHVISNTPLHPKIETAAYLVDVNTAQHWTEHKFLQDLTMRQNHETDPVPLSTTVTDPVPNPFRYPVLSSRYHYNFPQSNEDIYLRLGDAVLETDAYGHIGLTDGSYEAWMTGDSLDMAMEVLRRDEQCHAHGIAIANSAVAQICYFAHMSDDSSPQEYKEYKIQYEDKRWIFIIINDAIGGFETDIDQGSHWSFIAMDREGKTVHYYDSMEAHEYGTNYNREMGQNVGAGMLKILGEDTYSWKFVPEYLTPNQNHHNRSTSDGGACGPFVFKMMQYLIRQTIYWQSFGRSFPLGLESGFPLWFRDNHFDSRQIRREIQTSIARWKAIVEGIHLANIHDQNVLLDEDVILGYAPVETFWYPPQNLSTDMDYEKSNVTRTGIDREMSRPSTTDDTVLPTSSDPMEVDLTLEDAENEDEYDGGIHIVIHNNSDDENESLGLLPPLFTPSVSDDDEYYDMWR